MSSTTTSAPASAATRGRGPTEAFQSLNDVGHTIPAQGVAYWVGEAMQGTDHDDLDQVPEATAGTTRTTAGDAAHLARVLASSAYPA